MRLIKLCLFFFLHLFIFIAVLSNLLLLSDNQLKWNEKKMLTNLVSCGYIIERRKKKKKKEKIEEKLLQNLLFLHFSRSVIAIVA